jgi:hypothetical protein
MEGLIACALVAFIVVVGWKVYCGWLQGMTHGEDEFEYHEPEKRYNVPEPKRDPRIEEQSSHMR